MTKPSAPPKQRMELLREALAKKADYVADEKIGAALFLAEALQKPLLVEGPPGAGKTELALAAAKALQKPLIRLQCYEGLDETKALYEWQYGKQLLYTQLLKDKLHDVLKDAPTLNEAMGKLLSLEDLFFSEDFLSPRPLLKALREKEGAVLLLDEIDKADEAFEAFLLEILSDYQISIPELGTFRAARPPLVILTSNETRDLGGALRRRCLHLALGFPDRDRMRRIVQAHLPNIEDRLLESVLSFVEALREEDLRKSPSIAETVDWARALLLLHAERLDEPLVKKTLTALLKMERDAAAVLPRLETLLSAEKPKKEARGGRAL